MKFAFPLSNQATAKATFLYFSSSNGGWNTMYNELSSQSLLKIPRKNASLRNRIIATTDKDPTSILLLNDNAESALKGWIKNQRYYYKKQNKIPGNYLSHDQIESLNNLNFIWDVRECMWNIRLKELEQFKITYGHSIVPRNYKNFPKLAAWVHDIRNRRRNQDKETSQDKETYKMSSLTRKQISDLDNLDFVWEVQDSMWFEKFNQLKDFHEVNGHSQVTKSNYHNISLVNWVTHQRQRCKIEYKRNLLDSIDFVWDATQTRSDESSVDVGNFS